MDQAKPTGGLTQPNRTALPSIENMQSVTRPQTCDSSATTVPPSSIPNTEDSPAPAPDAPIATLLSSLPATNEAPPSAPNPTSQGEAVEPDLVNGQPIAEDQADKMNAEPAVELQVEELVRRSQKGKRRAPPQGRKAKRPRLGATQANLKKRARGPTRKPRAGKGKKASAAQGAPKKSRKNAQNTDAQIEAVKASGAQGAPKKGRKNGQNTENMANEAVKGSGAQEAPEKGTKNSPNETVKVGSSANDGGVAGAEKVPNPQASQLEVGEVDKVEKRSSHRIEKPDEWFIRGGTAVTGGIDGGSGEKENNTSQTNGKVTAEAECIEGEKRRSNDATPSAVDGGQQKGTDVGMGRTSGDSNGKVSQRQVGSASNGADRADKGGSNAHEEATLRDKYEDLSRRYLSLVRGLVQSGCDKKGEDSSDSDKEAVDGRAQKEIVDRKLYKTIYLCKVAGMLGAMKIEGGASKYVRANRLRGVDDGYKCVVKDGLEFVEDLMKLGRPDENSSGSVKNVFRDVHVRLVKDIWERNEDKVGAKALLLDMMTIIVDQITVWYMKMMDGEINILWSEMVGVKLTEALYKAVVKMDEEISEKVVSGVREILKCISEYYQECEQKTEKACLEKFCYSCEVSISIARSVPEAALTLEEEVAYAIGRHNGVFSHCVSRLVAEQEAKDVGGATTSGK